MRKLVALVAVVALVAFAAPAFAANPFMDVPMNHWAYDAVSQLAARGIVTGYPDGAFKGQWKATRYEMASVVARALAYVDMNKASKEDLELLKKLVVEFKDELDALGVKVEDLDKRVGALEDGVGGWKFYGHMRFTAKWSGEKGTYLGADDDTDFSLDRFRLEMKKYVDDKTWFYARVHFTDANESGAGNTSLIRAFANISMWDGTADLRIGKMVVDWGNYATDFLGWNMNDAVMTDKDSTNGFWFNKNFSMGNFEAFVMHDNALKPVLPKNVEDIVSLDFGEAYYYGAKLAFNFNEQFSMAAHYVVADWDNNDNRIETWWVEPVVNFTPEIKLVGDYYSQENDAEVPFLSIPVTGSWDADAYRVYLSVDQKALGFTSLWLEYADYEKCFVTLKDPYGWVAGSNLGERLFAGDSKVYNVLAKQKWNDQWGTYARWLKVETDGLDQDYTNWTVAVNYWYTPNVVFELGYDKYEDAYDVVKDEYKTDDDMIWFRTTVFF
jgi:hypothetical protein